MKTSFFLKSIHFLCFSLLLLAFATNHTNAQTPQGEILYDSPEFKILRIWGTHHERGYAYGYIMGSQISTMINSYLKPGFGNYYTTARNLVLEPANFSFNERYLTEANAMIEGMNASGNNPGNLDVTDILVGNAMLDIQGLLGVKGGPGCSSLMSWGEATTGTSLSGHAVVTRHLDWTSNSTLHNNHLLVIHQPTETDEQNWMMVGFAGMIGSLSGINNQAGIFQHMMDDYNGVGMQGQGYKPIWFAMRQAIETLDYNMDGNNDVGDLEAVMNSSANGFANGYLIAMATDNASADSLSAMVAELTPGAPTHVYRTNSLPDSIPGDNLYCANYQIARNDMMHFCSRYNSVRNHIGSGTLLGVEESWALLRDWSHQSNNIQLMQFAPSLKHFRIAVKKTSPAYLSDYFDFDVNEILNETTNIGSLRFSSELKLFPNPGTETIYLEHPIVQNQYIGLKLLNFNMKELPITYKIHDANHLSFDISKLYPGLYIIGFEINDKILFGKFIKQ